MYLTHRKTKTKFVSEIVAVNEFKLDDEFFEDSFSFDWSQMLDYDIFAIRIENDNKIQGLMALKNVPDELRVEIVLLESSKENIGENKVYERVAGCLIAFACRYSFLKGYRGFVSLIPKTRLIEHYIEAYGFEQFGRQLATETQNSQQLIKMYISDEA